MRTLSIDIETYSSVDLVTAGVHRYVESPDFQILLLGYSFDGGPVDVIDMTSIEGESPEEGHLLEVIDALEDPACLKTGWNVTFERTCLAKVLGAYMPPEPWSDTMVIAREAGLPGALADAGIALGLPEDQLKDPRGKALIQYFSKPCRPTKANGGRTRNLPAHDPDKWRMYIEYNRRDVVTEMAIRERLSAYALHPWEQELWCMDQRMNDRGVRLDMPMVDRIVRYDEQRREELQEEARRITGLRNPNSLAQLKAWLAENGLDLKQLRKDDLETLLASDLPDNVRRVLEIRQALGKTSTAKYAAMQEAVCEDNRLRGILQFYGANRTGRWAGRIVQTHNLARNSLPDLDLARQLTAEGDFDTLQLLFGETAFVFSELIRTAFIPSDGCRFVVSDFSAIEARVVAWLAGETWVLDAFRAGKDIYCETASMMYHVPVVKHGENGELRQRGKVAVLACGYGGGVGAMKAMDKSGTIPEEELQSVVDHWREANPAICKLWRRCEKAAKMAIKEHRPVRATSQIMFGYHDGTLFVRLPSGRSICYWGAKLVADPETWSQSIYYKGVSQTTKQWMDTETWGGKLVENIVQAVARDCLAVAMQRVTAMGYQIVMHVHDEMIVDVPVADKDALARINAAMGEPIPWAEGLPLRGDGYECSYYRKD